MQKVYCFLLIFLFVSNAFGQEGISDVLKEELSREKMYIHFDKKDYVLGDTIWYKTYLVDAESHKPSLTSGIVYVEFFDADNALRTRFTHHSILGTSTGNILLDTAFVSPGTYKIRAYTKWMQNLDDNLFFEKDIVIKDYNVLEKWFMTLKRPEFIGDSVNTSFRFTDERGNPQRNKVVDFYLMGNRGKIAVSDRLILDKDGAINVNFVIPESFRNKELFFRITKSGSKNKVLINAPFEREGDVDLQFLPEGGHLVAGFNNTVGFKGVTTNGRGIELSGIIKDSNGKEIAVFETIHEGMGYLKFKPEAGEFYTAYLSTNEVIALPKVENSGILLQLDKGLVQGDIAVRILATSDYGGTYYLRAKVRGVPVYQQKIVIQEDENELSVPLKTFSSGVVHWILDNDEGKTLSERAVFVDHRDHLNISLSSFKESYTMRDSIPLKVVVKDSFGNPVMGTFSISVTDALQVDKSPELDSDIRSYLLLESDLRGTIEDPSFYFTSDSGGAALNALLLTQGFVRYDWHGRPITHPAESEFTVSGRVIKGIKGTSPIEGSRVTLASLKRSTLLLQTVTDKNGRFIFKDIPAFDTTTFIVIARNAKGRSFNVGVKIDWFKPASFENMSRAKQYADWVTIWDAELDVASVRERPRYIRRPGLLDEVVITKKIIKDSKNLNGAGNADLIFNQEDIKKMPNYNIFELLKKYVNGYIPPFDPEGLSRQDELDILDMGNVFGKIENRPVHFRIDGDRIPPINDWSPIDMFMLRSDNIKGIEVMKGDRFTRSYGISSAGPFVIGKEKSMQDIMEYYDPVYIEITTLSGAGKGTVIHSHTPGVESFMPNIFYYGKEFYSPKYGRSFVEDGLPDLRRTIYWNPLVVTNENGEAEVSFYAADLSTNYLIDFQGMNLNGSIGSASKSISINKN